MYLSIGYVANLLPEDNKKLKDLLDIYNYHIGKNLEKAKYYEGHIPLSEVNLGIALPQGLQKLEIGCEWGGKCVDVLAARSMFDGFVGSNGEAPENLNKLVIGNRLISEYMKACRDELKYGCTFATLSADKTIGAKIRFHSPETAACMWSGEKGRVDCGFAIIDTAPDEKDKATWTASIINLYTDTHIIVIRRNISTGVWSAEYHSHKLGRPMIEPLVWNPTSDKPFGRSRIKEPVRRLIQGYVRTIANATIGLEFATSPQKYLLGVTDDQYDAIVDQKFKQYVGSILTSTTNPETGEKPSFGQLQQGSITPHVEMIRILATQFSAATGLTVTDTGVVNNANPTSSDAILAQSQTLVLLAEELNTSNGDALNMIARMAVAISENKSLNELETHEEDFVAHFKNPAMPSVAVTTDSAIKLASVRENFGQTDTFLEMVGFDQADIRRIKAQEQRARGQALLEEALGENSEEGVD